MTLKKILNDIEWRQYYKVVVGAWGISPADFWKMSLSEFYLILEAKAPEKTIGCLPESVFNRLSDRLDHG